MRTRCPSPRRFRGGGNFFACGAPNFRIDRESRAELAGAVSDAAQGVPALAEFAAQSGLALEQLGLKSGLLLGVIFPVILLIGTAFVQEPRYARKD